MPSVFGTHYYDGNLWTTLYLHIGKPYGYSCQQWRSRCNGTEHSISSKCALFDKIKAIFRHWCASTFGNKPYYEPSYRYIVSSKFDTRRVRLFFIEIKAIEEQYRSSISKDILMNIHVHRPISCYSDMDLHCLSISIMLLLHRVYFISHSPISYRKELCTLIWACAW